MEEVKLSDDVIEQIKDFNYEELTKEQESLIDKLILNEELKKRCKEFGLCKECKQPNTSSYHSGMNGSSSWCQSCSSKRFQQNFKNWASGNQFVDELIQGTQLKAKWYTQVMEWIEYDRFYNIEFLAKGGFGTTDKATWKDGHIFGWDSKNNQWKRVKEYKVALKHLHNSQNMGEFLGEVESHVMVNDSREVNRCLGISKDPKTNSFIMVIDYAQYGSLRQYLNNNFTSLSWQKKLFYLYTIAGGLATIHDKGLIHHDFHCGNILSCDSWNSRITDLGLCKPANEKSGEHNKNVYGVLPYVAPEVLRGKEYTQASDIYGYGIIAHEICTGLPPYNDVAHDEILAIRICNGLRPKSNYKIPQLILDIIKKCLDADPLKRPKAKDLNNLFVNLYNKFFDSLYDNKESTIYNQAEEADEINKNLPSSTSHTTHTSTLSYTTHPQAIYISRLLGYKNLPEPKNNDNDESFRTEYSESMRIDITKLNIKDE